MNNNSANALCVDITHIKNLTSFSKALGTTFSLGVLILLAVPMVLLVLITVLRNALVIWTIVVDKNLRQRSNYLFFNLAILGFEMGKL
uniref:G-protein coupled receptors family 1 profile domain-containing protein n=1 Tax=Terrapene triunguis TaxID=2587831 RepID=A0A674K9L1_9SAUR